MSKTTLIIGCGNKYKNHYEIHDKNSFTIDENKRLEPDFVCVFGKDTLENNIKNNEWYSNKIKVNFLLGRMFETKLLFTSIIITTMIYWQ